MNKLNNQIQKTRSSAIVTGRTEGSAGVLLYANVDFVSYYSASILDFVVNHEGRFIRAFSSQLTCDGAFSFSESLKVGGLAKKSLRRREEGQPDRS